MKVLVTGAAGFIGRALTARLIELGMEVAGLDKGVFTLECAAQCITEDITDPSAAERIAAKAGPCGAVVHAAASIDMSPHSPGVVLVNCLGTQQVIRTAELVGAGSFVFFSSVPVIGAPRQLPVDEDHPVGPLTTYHATKLFGEHLVRMASERGMTGTSLRLTAPVGPGMPDNRILSSFVRKALANEPLLLLGQGTRRQNYVDVRDVADAAALCVRKPAPGVFNVAGPATISNLELAELCIRTFGSSSEIGFTGAPDPEEGLAWEVSTVRAANVLGYGPKHGIESSVSAVGAQYADRLR